MAVVQVRPLLVRLLVLTERGLLNLITTFVITDLVLAQLDQTSHFDVAGATAIVARDLGNLDA